MEAAHQTGRKRPRNPAAYFRTILHGYERDGIFRVSDLEATAALDAKAQKQGDKDFPDGPELKDWELQWLKEQKEIKKKRLEQEQADKQEGDQE